MAKNLPAMQEPWVRSLDWEDPLEKGMVTHSSILGLENLNHLTSTLCTHTARNNFLLQRG